MARPRLNIRVQNELQKEMSASKLRTIKREMAREIGRVERYVAEEYKTLLQKNAPLFRGHLRNSISVEPPKSRSSGYKVTIGKGAEYWYQQEFGIKSNRYGGKNYWTGEAISGFPVFFRKHGQTKYNWQNEFQAWIDQKGFKPKRAGPWEYFEVSVPGRTRMGTENAFIRKSEKELQQRFPPMIATELLVATERFLKKGFGPILKK